MKIRFKDLLFNNEEIELDVKDIIIMTGKNIY